MQQIVTITHQDGRSVVSARELYEFLTTPAENQVVRKKANRNPTRFNDWISRMLEYGFIENVDYVVLLKNEYNSKGGRPSIDYAITIDCAKEISMLQKTDKGKEARKYFIDCEKRLAGIEPQKPVDQLTRLDIAKMLVESEEANLKLLAEKAEAEQRATQLETTIKAQAPKVEYAEKVLSTDISIGVLTRAILKRGVAINPLYTDKEYEGLCLFAIDVKNRKKVSQ